MNIFPVYIELQKKAAGGTYGDELTISRTSSKTEAAVTSASSGKRANMFKVSARSMMVCGGIYALAGVFGYMLFKVRYRRISAVNSLRKSLQRW